MLNSLWIALSTYSRLPVPQAEWNEKNMTYSMAFLPVIGMVLGVALFVWFQVAEYFSMQPFLTGAIATGCVLLVTGGIHLDGLCDTFDALSSHQDKERKLEIMKDAHIGAFGVIGCCFYLILLTACFSQLAIAQDYLIVGLVFVLSRAISGYLTQVIPNAKGTGMLMSFTGASDRRKVATVLLFWMLAAIMVMLFTNWFLAICAMLAEVIFMGWYLHKITKEFGGITGDLIGCFLQLSELIMLLGIIVGELLWNCI